MSSERKIIVTQRYIHSRRPEKAMSLTLDVNPEPVLYPLDAAKAAVKAGCAHYPKTEKSTTEKT